LPWDWSMLMHTPTQYVSHFLLHAHHARARACTHTHTHTHYTRVQGYGNKKFVFQGVHETICYGPAEHPWKEDEEPVNQIVFIGKGLDRKVCSV